MTLKEMRDYGVACRTEEELLDVLRIFEEAGWKSATNRPPMQCSDWWRGRGIYIRINDRFAYGSISEASRNGARLILLNELKYRNNIPFNPKNETKYYFINLDTSKICSTLWENSAEDNLRLSFGNFFFKQSIARSALKNTMEKINEYI